MGFKYAIRTDRLHFRTHTVVDWVDLFTRRDLAMVVVDSLNYCVEQKGLEVYVWCLMPSHLHMIASVLPGNPIGLSDVMRDFKRFTSKKLLAGIDNEFESRREWLKKHFQKGDDEHQVWKEGMHPIELYSGKFIKQKVNYIHMNPVVAGMVEEPEHYLFSSARDYTCWKLNKWVWTTSPPSGRDLTSKWVRTNVRTNLDSHSSTLVPDTAAKRSNLRSVEGFPPILSSPPPAQASLSPLATSRRFRPPA